jgi:hypothetical protein
MHYIPGTSLMKYYNKNKELLIKRYFTPHFPYLASFFHSNQFNKKKDMKIVIFDCPIREIPTRYIFVAIVVYPVLPSVTQCYPRTATALYSSNGWFLLHGFQLTLLRYHEKSYVNSTMGSTWPHLKKKINKRTVYYNYFFSKYYYTTQVCTHISTNRHDFA